MTARGRVGGIATAAIAALLVPPALAAQERVGPRPDYAAAAAGLEQLITHELATTHIQAISIALVDDREIVWAAGFGWARPRDSVPATAETVYRAGSVSKIFTGLAVMRLVEEGKLELDAPVTRYLPDFAPRRGDGAAITLRMLLAHHAGLVREPARGSYFDMSAPSLAATVGSLNDAPLVFTPGTRFKYSNAGITLLGAVIERVTGEPFADYVRRAVLRPLGAEHSDYVRTPAIAARIADGEMWTVDGRRSAAPAIEFGIAPAISLYAPVSDLARALAALFDAAQRDTAAVRGGNGAVMPLVRRETLAEMWTPQSGSPTARGGVGLGFFISRLDGRRRVWHDGAVYGFGMQLSALPDDRLGVVVASTLEGSSAALERIAAYALRSLIAARAGQSPPPMVTTQPLAPGAAARLAGRYTNGLRDVELRRRGDTLYYVPGPGRPPLLLQAHGDTLVVDDPRDGGLRLLPVDGRIVLSSDTLHRVPATRPGAAPRHLLPLLGEYGWDHNVMYVFEQDGHLVALLQWFFAYPLSMIDDSTYAFPPLGLYPGEHVVFRGSRYGRVTGAVAGNVFFPRRHVGPGDRGQLHLRPQRPVASLLRAARRAIPPVDSAATQAPDLVDLASLDATLRFDIRYATTNNFLGSVFYGRARAFLQRPAAEALLRAHRRLRTQGFGLLIHDGYRPWYVTKTFWDATPPESRWLVADPARGSRHNRGCAVDLTLYDLATGRPVDMVATYDEATARSRPDYPGGTALQRWHREVLRAAMESEGFVINTEEWWHFDYPGWRLYPIMNTSFEALKGSVLGVGLR